MLREAQASTALTQRAILRFPLTNRPRTRLPQNW